MIDLALTLQLAMQCAPNVAPVTMAAIVQVESSNNPYAIGIVGEALPHQPTTKADALVIVDGLERQGKNYSMGLAQINRQHLPPSGLTHSDMFEPCPNLRLAGRILETCYRQALPGHADAQSALRAALSCYYSGNFIRGFQPDRPGDPSYVEKVIVAAGQGTAQMVVPAIQPIPTPFTMHPEITSPVLADVGGEDQEIPDWVGTQDDDVPPARLRLAPETPPAMPPPTRQMESGVVVF